MVMKIHRSVPSHSPLRSPAGGPSLTPLARRNSLGRMSFRAIKSKRDYLRKGQSASWMYMSRLAAIKEYAFMKVRQRLSLPARLLSCTRSTC